VGETSCAGTAIRVLADRRDAQSSILHGSPARTWAPPKLFSMRRRWARGGPRRAYAPDVTWGPLACASRWLVALEIGAAKRWCRRAPRCARARPHRPPVWLDAPREFRAAVERFDTAAGLAGAARGAGGDSPLSRARDR
jgi:hypothetical protein